ncbi:MAG: hypothetical protein AAF228_02985 [Pseudomonadota bacterium]
MQKKPLSRPSAGALILFGRHKDELYKAFNILADSGYSAETFSTATEQILGCSVEIAKRNELHNTNIH